MNNQIPRYLSQILYTMQILSLEVETNAEIFHASATFARTFKEPGRIAVSSMFYLAEMAHAERTVTLADASCF